MQSRPKMKNPNCVGICTILKNLAESQGFEPWIPFWSIHTFQACSFDHSDNSPENIKTEWGANIRRIMVSATGLLEKTKGGQFTA
jgi:hypothetical protein